MKAGFRMIALAIGALASVCCFNGSAGAAGDSLLDIMHEELQRNYRILSKEPVPPYFLSYAVQDTAGMRVRASFGALVESNDFNSRTLDIDVRVGDYELDNTRQIRGDNPLGYSSFSRISLPLENSAEAIRLILWSETDRKYKSAVERLTRVKTNVAAKVKSEDPAADFSREEPQVYPGKTVFPSLDRKLWEGRLRRVSGLFARNPLIFAAEMSLSIEAENRYFLSSEGARLTSGQTYCRLFLQAMTKSGDGMELPLYYSYFAITPDGLPVESQLAKDALEMIDMLDRLRSAPIVEPYSGPAILSGRAAGVFFHEIFGHRIEGHRQKNTDDAQTFADKVGQAILPEFISVVFDPTLQKLGDAELIGHYLYDDEGVRARRVEVVDEGILKTFLLSRSPLADFPQSNGHGRRQSGFRPVSRQSNLIVEATTTHSYKTLVEKLKEECRRQGKPFGLFFQNIEGGFTFTGRSTPNAFNVLPNVVYRIYTDDRPPELVRGVDLIGTPLAAFGKIIAAGDTMETFNGMCGAESGNVPVSASSPALLISEVEVQKKAKSEEPLPILSSPDASLLFRSGY